MVEEATVYCGSCGEALPASARFCRSCGAPQEDFATQQTVETPPAPIASPPTPTPVPPPPQPPAPSPAPWSQPAVPAVSSGAGQAFAAWLAIAGGIGMCFMVLYEIVYVPLHHDLPVFFDQALQFGDLLAFGCGALAIVLGALALRRTPANGQTSGAVLMAAGLLPVVLVGVWAFPEALGIEFIFSRPFYFGFVYFCELGQAHIGSGYVDGHVQVPLLVSSLAVSFAGCIMAFTRGPGATGPAWQ